MSFGRLVLGLVRWVALILGLLFTLGFLAFGFNDLHFVDVAVGCFVMLWFMLVLLIFLV